MTTTLDDLLGDGRLARLFSNQNHACALQLWVLQIKSEQSTEIRIVYGRLLPYSHSSNAWSFSDNDNHLVFGNFKAKFTRLNLYIDSILCAELLRQLSAGQSISAINEILGIDCPKKLIKQFGATTLVANNLAYRPVAYLLNRDAHEHRSLSSPHSNAGAISASITQMNKESLFLLGEEYSTALTISLVEWLDAETGLDFCGADATRFGDLELLVFPTLNDLEQNLLSVNWINSPHAVLSARFAPTQVPFFDKFQFHLSISNDGKIISSTIAFANRQEDGIYEYIFHLSEELRKSTDSSELEIFGFSKDCPHEGVLCCRWRIVYIREINIQGHAVGQRASPIKFDWLEKATRPAVSDRVKTALTVNRCNLGFGNQIGGREADPWVPANSDLLSLFTRLHPPKSEGKFFQRWSMGDGEGRLQFVEWFRSLLTKYQKHQIVIFDPYFETAGLGLVLICAAANSDYIVFTSLPKASKGEEDAHDDHERSKQGRVNNLIASCEHNSHLSSRIKFRIYGLKEGRLHDRYILIMGSDKLPIAGFHLSNSFQKAAENYPLLITPIPADVLLQVEQYKSEIMKEAMTTSLDSEVKNPVMRLLFDSKVSPSAQRRYEPLRFLDKPDVGSVLSIWSGEVSLKGLSGNQLRAQMVALGLLKDDSLILHDGLHNFINDKQVINSKDFRLVWGVLGEILAHSRTGNLGWENLESESYFIKFLSQFVEESFNRLNENIDKELAVVDVWFFRKPVEALLHSPYRTEHLFHSTKYAALNWSEYFAIKILWRHAPDCLLTIADAQISSLQIELEESEVMRLSLLSQIVSEVSLSIQFNISKIQRDSLVHSNQGLLKWLGFNAIERQLDTPEGLTSVLSSLETLSHQERVLALGWMINRAAIGQSKDKTYKDLVLALHEELPETISMEELRDLVDSLRGHMKQLAWAEPWLSQDVVLPLLQNARTFIEYACDIWIQELASMMGPPLKNESRLFERAREGQITNIASFFFANSSTSQRESSLTALNEILKRQRRIIQQPLASTSNWTQWDDALRVSFWILAFCKWSEFYLNEQGKTDQNLERLSSDAHGLAMVRSIDEWQSEGVGIRGELIAFLDQAEKLLSEGGGLKSEPQ
ncbi:hypothetical protein FHW11_000684 [Pantoea agglomerans]|uniref:VPA1262 family protein n=1 Tax=Enterobacter agglomerans TaxID=549 RepID=UPI0015F8D6D4|nr:VPA1262 family protein [Pantoea agglomerans]MBA8863598.1 hypothetical protein [Pantoea agglomerans]MBA8890117.1 hypothetical protein [Pantoea agglomerans]